MSYSTPMSDTGSNAIGYQKKLWTRAGWQKHLMRLLVVCSLILSVSAQAQISVSGGSGLAATYTSLTNAGGLFAAINGTPQTGNNIVVSITGDMTTEAGTVSLNAGAWASIVISPSGGAARTISGAVTAGSPLINFNGADNVTIDGLNTGGNSLTISNTTASATSGTSTIRFIADATSNTITNCSVLGSGSMAVGTNGGNIFFSTGTTTGNDNNTISNCNIGPAGSNLNSKALYGNGSTTTTAIGNSGINITNNNIFDFFGAAVSSAGVYTAGGCNTWSITNNRFYQTATRTWTTGAQHSPIWITPATATSGAQGFTITGNTIGYASNSQTGTYTLTGTGSSARFWGIHFNGISTGASTTISNNTIASISMTGVTGSGTGTSSPFMAIHFQEGVGITSGNTIGSQSATGSLVFSTTTTSGTDAYGIYNFSSSTWTASNNNIGGISVTNLGASGTFVVYGLRANTGTGVAFTAASNNIGGTVANSIQLTATGNASQVIGMFSSNAPCTWTSNTVRNLTSNIGNGTTTGASVIGMCITTTTPNHTLSQNTIHSLSNTHATQASVVTGIQFTGSTANSVSKNYIHSLSVATNNASAEVNGIRVAGGTTTYANNMVAIGAGINNAVQVNGINEPLGTDNFYHNSVYVGGSPTAGTANSFAFNSTQTVNTRNFRNNIFMNARSNAGATGKNYAVQVGGSAPNPSGLTINYNIYSVTGTGAVFGRFNALDVADISAWKLAVGQDANSIAANPQYNDPTNATPDLHLHPTNPTPAEATGVAIGTVTDDFDGQARASFTPTDIGADAGNFVAAPTMTYVSSTATQLTANACAGSANVGVLRMEVVTAGSLSPLTLTSLTVNGNGTSVLGDVATYRVYYTGTNATFNTSTPIIAATPGLTSTDFTVTPSGTVTLAEGTNYFWLVYNLNTSVTGPSLDGEFTGLVLSSGAATPSVTAPAGVVSVFALPTVTVTPTSGTFCSPGGTAVSLNAGGANTYVWSPASGLSATTGATVTASPSASTTYTVTGTDANGCVNTANTIITVAPNVSISSVTATPSTVCTGNNSQLLATASVAGGNTAAGMSYSSQTGQSFETITSPTVETTTTSGTLDDGYKTVNTSPSFTFNFNGTNYSTFAAGTNGYVTIGGASSSIPSSITTLTGLNIVHAFGRDGNFNVTNGGNVTHGPAAGGKYVFEYNNYSGGASGAESPTITLSYQIVLWGNSSSSPGRIDIIYGTSAGTPASSGTIGIRDIAGTYINGINGSTSSTAVAAAWPASGQMYSFERIVTTYAWTPATYLDFTNIANPLATAVTTTETYTVTATAGVCSTSANVTVTVAAGAAITDDPDAVTKCAGETATFSVIATGPGLIYQWRKDGNNINTGSNPSAGTATLSLSNVSAADIATYDVVVTASCGSPVTSAGAALTVNTALAGINASATTVCAGTSVTLTENGGNATAWSWSPGGATTQAITVTPTVSTTYIVTTTFNGCNATASQLITVNPVPSAVSITPTSATICAGVPVALTASGGNIIESQVFNASSGTISLSIPDNISTGVSNSLAVSGIPGTATIDSVIVTFNMTHEFSGDAEVNLEAPNGQIINLMADRGGISTGGFVNTRVTSDVSKPAFSSGSNPFTGTFRADATAQVNLIGSPSVTTTTFSNLFGTSNGNWTIRAYDDANGDVGVLSNWSIKIAYTNNIPANFTWSPATGLDVTTGPSVNASPTTTTTYTATSTINGCSSFNTVEVTVTPDAAVSSVTGSSPLCIGATTTYTANGVVLSGGTGAWSSDNITVATVDNAGLVTAVSAGSAIISYTITGGCGGTVSALANVTVNPDANAGTVSGAATICTATTTTFTSNGDAGGTWSSDNNAVATVNPTSGLVTAVASGTANITYTVNSGCASPVSASASISVASGAAPVVTGTVNVCPLIGTGTPVVYTASSAGATAYNWIVPPTNVTIVSGQGTSTLTVLFLNGFAAQPNKQLRVTATSACGVSAQTIYYLLAQTASTPGPITGPNSACPFINAGNATYSIAAVPASTSYVWTVPVNASIVTGQGTTSITVSFNNSYATGAITVASVNDCGPSSVRSLTVTRNNPSTPGLISGPTNACPFITPSGAATYSVTSVPSVTSYTWSVPPGAIGLTGQGTNTISFTYPTGFTTGTVSVTASNGCGVSGARTLTIGTLQPATPSVIDVIQLQPCPNRVYSYTIASMPANAQSVLWTAPAGATILTGQGTTSITVSYPGTAVNGNVTATGVNNCGTSVARVSAVKLPACPPEERSADLFTKSGNQAVESMNVNIFPNPTTSDFKLQVVTAGKEEINVRILDIQGRYLKQITVMPYQTVNLGAELKAGSYLVEVKQGKAVKTTRVIKF